PPPGVRPPPPTGARPTPPHPQARPPPASPPQPPTRCSAHSAYRSTGDAPANPPPSHATIRDHASVHPSPSYAYFLPSLTCFFDLDISLQNSAREGKPR